ncbi:MAG: TIGR04219 family outer membrane beta-barrel protein [Nitrospirota bacterium]|nr:TIGR04219 family outer membrane beta-barrel protein [Nitrospirota bacterium]
MKKFGFLIPLTVVFTVLLLITPGRTYALGLEAAVGYWNQAPSGDLQYSSNDLVENNLDLKENLKYDSKARPYLRVKADLPLFLPNIYFMATPMKYEGQGSKDLSFTFGNKTFDPTVPFNSVLKADHYDIAVYYSLPFLNTATAGSLNVELGLNLRIIDFEAKISQGDQSESASYTLPIPMIYAAVQLKPVDLFSIEAEIRGITYGSNSYYDLIARMKVKPVGPVFIAGGYRYEKIKIDHNDVRASMEFKGPFIEAGVSF